MKMNCWPCNSGDSCLDLRLFSPTSALLIYSPGHSDVISDAQLVVKRRVTTRKRCVVTCTHAHSRKVLNHTHIDLSLAFTRAYSRFFPPRKKAPPSQADLPRKKILLFEWIAITMMICLDKLHCSVISSLFEPIFEVWSRSLNVVFARKILAPCRLIVVESAHYLQIRFNRTKFDSIWFCLVINASSESK